MTVYGPTNMEHICVSIADFKVAKDQGILITIGLGSCVGIMLYDPRSKVAGLAHIMLSDSTRSRNKSSPNKFADTGIRAMIKEMQARGALKGSMTAKIAGGACMFESAMRNPLMNIGDRNVEAVKKVLHEEGIRIIAEDVGKNYGRTVELHADTGKVLVKSAKYGAAEL